ncbi:MAG: peptidoglycan-binding protein [Clostridia bacterium]|nr:peptidoglycan-binding protein [Clostridia bacterium]
MQNKLMALGYALPAYGADGDFGKETENALKQFQKDKNLEPSGVYAGETRQLLCAEKEDALAPGRKIVIRSNGGSVNLRAGNGTEYEKVLAAENGKVFPYVAHAENGWYAVKGEKAVLWVSGEYSDLKEN